MPLSKEQKSHVIEKLNSPRNTVHLTCDGYKITLTIERIKMKLVVAIFINNTIQAAWFTHPQEHPESKFLLTRYKSYFSAKRKAEIIKAFGKREANKRYDLDKKFEYKLPYFNTAKSAIDHLIKVSDSIELVAVTF